MKRAAFKQNVKSKRCKCGDAFNPVDTFQKKCIPCLIKTGRKEQKREVRIKKAEDAEFKKRVQVKDLDYQHGLTQPVFNRMRVREELIWFRERGIEPYCISCQRTHMDWSCGHLKTRGAQSNIRYDRMNTYLQCNFRCNRNLSGNINGDKTSIGYKKGLIVRFGQEKGQAIIDYCDTHTKPRKWTGEELIELRAYCAAQIRELKKVLQS